MRKFSAVVLGLLVVAVALAFAGCGSSAEEEIKTGNLNLSSQEKFDNMYMEISIEDFNALGFEYGDSLKLEFTNGYEIDDVPYYNGFYGKIGTYEVVAYQGYPFVMFAENDFGSIWEIADLTEDDKVVISLNEKGKYLATQEALAMEYSVERDDYDSDEAFANFRSCKGGDLKENLVYRAASPFNNTYNRASYVSDLAEKAGITTILDLADSTSDLEEYDSSLASNSNVICLGLSYNYRSEEFGPALVEGLREMMNSEKPILVHCTEGKDRTGFVCALLEGLCGATYDEMLEDYMITYDNYYGISKESDADKYAAIEEAKFEDMAECIGDDDYVTGAREYLMNAGMTSEEVDALIEYLTK